MCGTCSILFHFTQLTTSFAPSPSPYHHSGKCRSPTFPLEDPFHPESEPYMHLLVLSPGPRIGVQSPDAPLLSETISPRCFSIRSLASCMLLKRNLKKCVLRLGKLIQRERIGPLPNHLGHLVPVGPFDALLRVVRLCMSTSALEKLAPLCTSHSRKS
jgi:hypothetical protein